MYKGICIGGPADGKEYETASTIFKVPTDGGGAWCYMLWTIGRFPDGKPVYVWAGGSQDLDGVIIDILAGYRVDPATNALRNERNELAERVTELCQKITKDGGRLGIIASRYGWRGSQNNIEFIGKRMAEMQEEIDVLRKYAAPPPPRVDQTITVDVTGMADIKKRLDDLERLAYGTARSGLNTRPLRDRG